MRPRDLLFFQKRAGHDEIRDAVTCRAVSDPGARAGGRRFGRPIRGRELRLGRSVPALRRRSAASPRLPSCRGRYGGETLGGRSVRMRRLSVKRADTTISSCDMYLLCRTARKRARISTAFRSVSRHAVLIMRRRFFSRWKLGSLHSARKTAMFFIQISSPILQITRLL